MCGPNASLLISNEAIFFRTIFFFKLQLRFGEQFYHSNSLLFRLFGGYYAAPATAISVSTSW